MPVGPTFRKILSLNDTGATGGHMAGILVPKGDIEFFPPLDTGEKNPRAELSMTDESGRSWTLNFIYYNNAFFGGTRDEYRLTGLTEYMATNRLVGGDTIVIRRRSDNTLELGFLKSNPLDGHLELANSFVDPAIVSKEDSGPKESFNHALRPAARLIHTIGQQLIKDPEAAIMEMVKNSYDADANNVHVWFVRRSNPGKPRELRIIVTDDGHGMTYEDVTGSWLVPATRNKADRRVSPKGRHLQGNKGIGRFAAFMLGDEIFLTTFSKEGGSETSLMLQASDFRDMEFLDQVRIIVDTREAPHDAKPGTTFEMTSRLGQESYREWGKEEFAKLRTDLRRMLSPFRSKNDEFQVWVHYDGFSDAGLPDGTEEVEALPVFDLYDYRIRAEVTEGGFVTGEFSSPLLADGKEETISFQIDSLEGLPCGNIQVDLRVVDREANALQDLLNRSRAADDTLTGVTRAQLRRLLDQACGISVYRGDFRIRPYGDSGNDWLHLDGDRINDPTMAVSNNQTFGLVNIEVEDKSHLQEKSARDGLREDGHYERLCSCVSKLVKELQRRRYEIRRATGRIRKTTKVGEMLGELRDYQRPFNSINTLLKSEGVESGKIELVREILRKDSESRQNIIAKLEETIAIYHAQAALGKMVSVLLHEGNRALGILRNQATRIPNWIDRMLNAPSPNAASEVKEGLGGIKMAAESLIGLFNRIAPLGIRHPGAIREVPLIKPIQTTLLAMEGELQSASIKVIVEVPPDFRVLAWEQDLNTIFLNLLENSIHWLRQSRTESPTIAFRLIQNDEGAVLDITDNGPGIPKEHILSGAIFEPHFSLKGGSGLGLPIAGENAARNGMELKAVHSPTGAHFVLDLTPPKKK
jgi:signal transduction histidine kinase